MMSMRKALMRARTIWGKDGYVNRRPAVTSGPPEQQCPANCSVGHLDGLSGIRFFSVKGSGKTFEEAFAAYERTERHHKIAWRSERVYKVLRACRTFVETHAFEGAAGEDAAALDNQLTELIDEIEGVA